MYSLLYIDPGTGSMIFSLFIGIAAAASFGLNALWMKLKFLFSGGKLKDTDNNETIPYVIYSDHKRYWNIFKPVCDEFEKRQIALVYYTSSPDDPVLEAGYKCVHGEFIGEGNKSFAKLNFLKADILLATTPGLDVYQWKRSKNVKYYVHISHAVGDMSSYRMFGLDYYDAIICAGENQVKWVKELESKRDIKPKELVLLGSTYLDAMREKMLSMDCSINKDSEPIILVAPSWGKSGILSKYGEKFIDAVLKTGYQIVIRPHPQTIVSEKAMLDKLVDKYNGTPNLSWNYDNNNFDIMSRSSLLISDFSGIIWDFALIFDRPIIYADVQFDKSAFDAYWSDEQTWNLRVLPDMGVKLSESDFDNMKKVIDNILSSKSLQSGRNKVRLECWENIGKAAQSAVDYLINKQMSLKSGKKNEVLIEQ